MQNWKKITISLSILAGVHLCSAASYAQEYEPWTGAVAGANIHFNNHETLNRIRKLINKGETADAVRESEKFITRLSINSRSGKTTRYLYDAYNALCISLTSNKQFDQAVEACNTAINEAPERWQAINSRGTLNYKTENYAEALSDYLTALEKAPDIKQIQRIIEHNVKISQARVSGN